ncbi:MAG: class I SAM-dependent rRNA methyltransferase [Planctomycetaceae bacterium]
MTSRKSSPGSRHQSASPRQPAPAPQVGPSLLTPRPFLPGTAGEIPVVQLRSVRRHPSLFRKLVGEVDRAARPGDFVRLLAPQGETLGYGFYNPMAEIAVRVWSWGPQLPDPETVGQRLDRALALRRDLLQLDSQTTAQRLIHAESDGFPGLVVDRYGDVLSAETFSLAMYQRVDAVLDLLEARLGTRHRVVQAPAKTHGQEGFTAPARLSEGCPTSVIVEEFSTRFRVDFEAGHKTGFFCDQRENRRQLAHWTKGRTVLDLCCYTGGFALQAAVLGEAASVTAVDLDEGALATARANARLNRANIRFVQDDAFQHMRNLISEGKTYEVVILDPPKLIRNRAELETGERKHLDLNRLALQIVAPGGLLLTCTCSGLLGEPEFLRLLQTAARQAGTGRTIQFLQRTGAAADHPVLGDVPETEYLHAAWLRVLE